MIPTLTFLFFFQFHLLVRVLVRVLRVLRVLVLLPTVLLFVVVLLLLDPVCLILVAPPSNPTRLERVIDAFLRFHSSSSFARVDSLVLAFSLLLLLLLLNFALTREEVRKFLGVEDLVFDGTSSSSLREISNTSFSLLKLTLLTRLLLLLFEDFKMPPDFVVDDFVLCWY